MRKSRGWEKGDGGRERRPNLFGTQSRLRGHFRLAGGGEGGGRDKRKPFNRTPTGSVPERNPPLFRGRGGRDRKGRASLSLLELGCGSWGKTVPRMKRRTPRKYLNSLINFKKLLCHGGV